MGPGLLEAVSGDRGDTGCLSCSEGSQCTALCAVFPTECVHEAHSLYHTQRPPCEVGDGLCAVRKGPHPVQAKTTCGQRGLARLYVSSYFSLLSVFFLYLKKNSNHLEIEATICHGKHVGLNAIFERESGSLHLEGDSCLKSGR